MVKIISEAVVTVNNISEVSENKINDSQNQCTCTDTYCGCM